MGYSIIGSIISYTALCYLLSDMFISEPKLISKEFGAHFSGQLIVTLHSKLMISVEFTPMRILFFFISLHLGLMNFFILVHYFGKDGNALKKWMRCEGSGKLLKLWNDFWEPIVVFIFWIIPILIPVTTVILLLFSQSSNDHHGMARKLDENERIPTLCMVFIMPFAFGKNRIFQSHCLIL